ncbi:DUF4926 domain-containing protein [Parasediminibacterium sp. JCM 36343]|uniref:DUF4926 domain-containing protein n=1 Tax=Parasediminibacterium sp. JCM 36343 TaxID=3374279 RepID=UPI003978C63E
MNKFELYSEVQLAKDLPELGFIKGDIATIVEIIENKNGEYGYCLEFFDGQGNTLEITVVAESAIQKPILHGVVNYREYVHS